MTDMQDQQHTIRTRSLPAPALKKDGSQQTLHLPHSGVGERGGNCLPGHTIHYNIAPPTFKSEETTRKLPPWSCNII